MSLVAGLTPGESLGIQTEDRHMHLKLTRRRVQSTTRVKNKQILYKPLFMTWSKGSEFENSGNKIN
jgi:acid stress-induced BolA-like protein IbaG/YrbA